LKELIKKIKGIVPLSAGAEEYLQSIAKKRSVSKGEVLIREGQSVNKIFLVTDGCIRSYCTDKNGKEHTLIFAIKN
jgi:CRP-like cAMP-binding protein